MTDVLEPLELYPDEQNRFISILADVNRKFIGKYDTRENMIAYGNEVVGRCRDELGLVVSYNPSAMKMGSDGNWYTCPEVTPLKRVESVPFDFEKARKEVQAGFADGVPGVLTEDGRLVEPVKRVPISGVELG